MVVREDCMYLFKVFFSFSYIWMGSLTISLLLFVVSRFLSTVNDHELAKRTVTISMAFSIQVFL